MQRWAAVAGWLSLLLPIPSVLWRLAMLAGVDTGFAEADFYRSSTETVAYVAALDVVEMGAAILVFGLIRPWGEVVPRWVPGVGGRIIPRYVPTALGAAGAVLLCLVIGSVLVALISVWSGMTDGWTPDAGMSAAERTVLLVAYIPFFCWPIAVCVTVVGYWLRRRPG